MGPRRLAVAVLNTMSSVRIHPGVPPVTLLRRNFAQALCRQSCARAPAARLRGGTGPWMLRCEAPAPGLQRGAISRLSRATSKLAPLSAAAAAAAGAAAGADAAAGAARLSDSTRVSTRASRASDAAGGVAGGSDRGSTVEVEAGGCGGPLSLFNGRVRGLGGQPGGRGSTRRRRTVGHRGNQPVRRTRTG